MNKVNGYYTTVGYEWKVFLHKAPALDESDWGDIHPCTIMADNIFDGMMLYTNQADIESDDIVWYGTSAQAWDAIEKTNPNTHETCNVYPAVLSTKKVDPLPKHFEVEITKTHDGRYMASFVPHPETSGVRGRKKPFFPDRSWKGLICEGTAVVRMTKEFERYGFIVGKMKDFKPVEAEMILEWVRNYHCKEYLTYSAMVMEGPLGEYFVISDWNRWQAIQPANPDVPDDLVLNEFAPERLLQDTVKQRGILAELLFEKIYGKPSEEILDFKENAFWGWKDRQKLLIEWKREDEDFGSDLLHEAICMDLFSTYRLTCPQGISEKAYAIVLNTENLVGLFDFSIGEISEMMKFASDVNQREEEKIRKMARSGRISVRTPVSLVF